MSFWASQAGNFKNLRMLPRQHAKNHIIDGSACTKAFSKICFHFQNTFYSQNVALFLKGVSLCTNSFTDEVMLKNNEIHIKL